MTYEENFLKLEHYRRLVEKRRMLFEQRQEVENQLEGLSSPSVDGMPKAKDKPNYALEIGIERKNDLSERINRLDGELKPLRKHIYAALDEMTDNLSAYILEAHFVNDASLNDIADASGYSFSWVKKENIDGIKNINLD